MADDRTIDSRRSQPANIKLAAWYLIIVGIGSMVLLAALFTPLYPDRTAWDTPTLIRHAVFEVFGSICFLVAGIGLLKRATWAKHLALVVLGLSVLSGAASFAEGYADGRPTAGMFIVSLVLAGLWNGLWIYLICRRGNAIMSDGVD